MERMVAAELALSPAYISTSSQLELSWPASVNEVDAEQFFDANLFALQCKMCEFKCQISDAVGKLRQSSDAEAIIGVIWPCVDALRVWRETIPPYLAFTFDNGVPSDMHHLACSRGVASFYLRYHQVGQLPRCLLLGQ